MKKYSEEVKQQQHKQTQARIKVGNWVMARIHVPAGNSNKLPPKYTGPYSIMELTGANKFKIQHVYTGETQIRHADDAIHTNMAIDERLPVQNKSPDMSHGEKEDLINDTNEQHP